MGIRHRLGTFFILIGVALLLLFLTSIYSKDVNGIYLPFAIVFLAAGFLLGRNKPVNDSGRFGAIRRMNERSRKRREEKKKPPQKK